MSFPHLFIHSLVEVHRSSFSAHALFFPVFIHRILLHLGLEQFLESKPVHIIAPIGATFLQQRTTQMRASSKRLRVESSSSGPPPPAPSSSGDLVADEFIDPTTANAPPPPALDVSRVRRTLDTIMTIQAAHGQLLVDVLTELQALHAILASLRRSPPPPPFNDRWLSSGNSTQKEGKREYIWIRDFVDKGRFLLFRSFGAFRLYLSASSCIYIFWLMLYFFFSCL